MAFIKEHIGVVVSALYILCHLIFTDTSRIGFMHHVIDEETEANKN